MLNFIVMGSIPGTQAELTYYALLIILLSALVLVMILVLIRHRLTQYRAQQTVLKLISL